MKATVVIAAGLISAGALALAGQAVAQDSLGDPAADEAVADLKAQAGGAELSCTFVGGWVTCSGARVGDCLDAGWLVNHSGGTCRKKVS